MKSWQVRSCGTIHLVNASQMVPKDDGLTFYFEGDVKALFAAGRWDWCRRMDIGPSSEERA